MEVLLPVFTDESRQVTMETALHDVTDFPLPELRLVLLGRKGAGKSSAGHTILDGRGGSELGKPTEECAKRCADVWGRRVTVVDTPGWEWYYPLNSTPDWVRRETLRCATLCPPGPHALLLVVRSCGSVTEAFLAQIAEHLEPMGGGVWDHTLVLFTCSDKPSRASVEQQALSSGGRALRKLLEKCGNRYHVLDNRGKGDSEQVRELLRKTEEMAERGGHFGVDGVVLSGLGEDRDRRAEERRKKQRHTEEQTQREAIRASLSSESIQESREPDRHHSFSRMQRRLPELRLLLLGERETGKSSAGNAILGGASFFRTGAVTEECVCRQSEEEASGRLVTVVDTPGWEAGVAGPTPERVKREMLAGMSLCPPGPHAVLLALRVDTEVRAAPVREHLEPLGEGVWRHTLLLFTHGDQLREGVGIEQHVRRGGRDLRWLLEKCGGRYHVISSTGGGGGTGATPGTTQVTELLEKVEKMAAGNRCEAFSSLVQEVGDLSRQRSGEFARRLAELGAELRRESELRRMRETEAKSVPWLFARRRKIKSPGKAGAPAKEEEEAEDEDRQSSDAKAGTGDAEERIRWLMEDKERAIRELSAEQDRMLVELRQSSRERQEAARKLEQREAEIQEHKERVEEQQLQILELRQAGLEMDRERGQWDEIKDKRREWATEVETLTGRTERCEHENVGLLVEVEMLRGEIVEMKLNHENALSRLVKEEERWAREKEKAMAETKRDHNIDTERRIHEKEMEVQKMEVEVRRASQAERDVLEKMQRHEKDTEKKLDWIKSQHQSEIQRKIEEREEREASLKLQHEEDIARKVSELETLMESGRAEHREEMGRKLKEKDEYFQREKQREVEELKKLMSDEMQRHATEGGKERVAMEIKFAIRMEEQAREKEKENERIRLKYETQLGQKLQKKESYLEELKREHADTVHRLQVRLKDNDELLLNDKNEMERRLKEKLREVEEMKLHVKEVEERLEKSEKDRSNGQTASERNDRHNRKELQELREMNDELRRKEKEALQAVLCQKTVEAQRLAATEQEVEEIKLQMGAELNRKLQEKESEVVQRLEVREQEIEEIKLQMEAEFNRKLQEKDLEVEEVRRQTEERESKWMNEQRKRDERGETEMNRLLELVEEKTQEVVRVRQVLAEGGKELEEARRKCTELLGEIKQLEECHRNTTASVLETWQRHDANATAVLREKEAELSSSRDRERDWEKEIAHLRQTIELTKSELKVLTGQMEREMTRMIHEYEKEVTGKNGEIESLVKEKAAAAVDLQQTRDESERRLCDVVEKYEWRLTEMHEQNATIGKEMEHVKGKFVEQEREQEAERALRRRMEETIKELSAGYEELAAAKEAAIKNALAQNRGEVGALEEISGELWREIMRMAEDEREGRVEREKRDELDARAEGEGGVKAGERRLEQGREELEKRLRELDAVEEAAAGRDRASCNREKNLSVREADLEIKWKETLESQRGAADREEALRREEEAVLLRTRSMRAKEQALDRWLEDLENKQKELNDHGLDLQTKVQELKAWGKRLEGRDGRIERLEQELLGGWGADSEVQCRAPSSEGWQHRYMAQNLAQAQEELHGRERDLRETSDWARCLQSEHVANGHCEGDGDDCFSQGSDTATHTEASRAAPGAVGEGDRKLVTVEEGENEEEERIETDDGMDQRVEERGKEADAKVISDSRMSSPRSQHLWGVEGQHGQGRSELRVLVLGEARSSRCSAGATVLGAEPAPGVPWRGEIAGRRIALVEPLGLRWRGGPAGTDDTALQRRQQQEQVLRSASAFRPHVVLLAVPAYLTCTPSFRRAAEEDVRALGGEEMWRRAVVLLTWAEALGESAEQHILRSGDLSKMVERCGRRYHVMAAGKNHASPMESLFEKLEEVVALNNDGQAVISGEL